MQSKISRELLILIIGRILQVILLVVTLKISTTILEPTEIGKLYFILSIYSFFGLFMISPIGQYINRKIFDWYNLKIILNKLVNLLWYILFVSFITYLILLIVSDYYNEKYFKDMVYLLPLYVLFITISNTLIPLLNMLGRKVAFVICTNLGLLISLIISSILCFYFEKNITYWFLGQVIGFFVISIISIYYFVANIDNNFDLRISLKLISKENIFKILFFSIPLSISIFFVWIQTQSYRIIVEHYIGLEFLGYLTIGIALATAISTSFESIIIQYLYPDLHKSMNNTRNFELTFNYFFNLTVPIYITLVVFVSFCSPFIVNILIDSRYSESYIYLIFGMFIEFFRIITNFLSTISFKDLKTKELVSPNMIGALFSIICVSISTQIENYKIFIPLSLFMGMFISMLLIYIKMKKYLVINIQIDIFKRNFLYILVFSTMIFFYSFKYEKFSSILIVVFYGLIFLYIIFKHVINTKKVFKEIK